MSNLRGRPPTRKPDIAPTQPASETEDAVTTDTAPPEPEISPTTDLPPGAAGNGLMSDNEPQGVAQPGSPFTYTNSAGWVGNHIAAPSPESSLDDYVAALRAAGNDDIADRIEANAAAAAQVDVDEPEESEDEPDDEPSGVPAPVEAYYRKYGHAELMGVIADAIDGKAEGYRMEAAEESVKGAADQTKMTVLRWGADQLDELARLIRNMPDGEWVLPEVES